MPQTDAPLQNRYRIIRQLGQGGMGAVYEALDTRLNLTVALKKTLAETAELRRAFAREAELLANLNHPALPKVTDHFTEGGGQYLVMDYVPGDDLKTLLIKRGKSFSAVEVAGWADDLLDALVYLHGHEPPIIHRDVKPSNLKLNAKRKLVLLDFGLAKGTAGQMTEATQSRSVYGFSPHFAPLEQVQGERTTVRSDLYSAAATLYHLLTGRVPPDALTRAASVFNDNPDPLVPVRSIAPDVPDGLASVLMMALALKPAERPRSAAEMRSLLQGDSGRSSAGSNLSTAPGVNRIDPTPKGAVRKSRALLYLAAAIITLYAGFSLWAIYSAMRPGYSAPGSGGSSKLTARSTVAPSSQISTAAPMTTPTPLPTPIPVPTPEAPRGWRFPEAKDVRGDWKAGGKGSAPPYRVRGDFNADGLRDEAWILIPGDGKGSSLFVFLKQRDESFRSVQLEYSEEGAPQNMFISIAEKGAYDTACGKGYWDCKAGEPPVLRLRSPGIWYGVFESAASIFYWDADRKTFERVWISD